jgi:hypothetical protein
LFGVRGTLGRWIQDKKPDNYRLNVEPNSFERQAAWRPRAAQTACRITENSVLISRLGRLIAARAVLFILILQIAEVTLQRIQALSLGLPVRSANGFDCGHCLADLDRDLDTWLLKWHCFRSHGGLLYLVSSN